MQWGKHGYSNAAENHTIFIPCIAIIGNGVVVLNTTALSFVLTQYFDKLSITKSQAGTYYPHVPASALIKLMCYCDE